MEAKATIMQLAMVLVTAFAADIALPGCSSTCGNTSIPYPFGIGTSTITGNNCFLAPSFSVHCRSETLYLDEEKEASILNISLDDGQLEVERNSTTSNICYNNSIAFKMDTPFALSGKGENKFVTIGCDVFGYLTTYHGRDKSSTGCLTSCDDHRKTLSTMRDRGSCTGVGCCEADIPPSTRGVSAEIQVFNLFPGRVRDIINCSYTFIAKQGSYNHAVRQFGVSKQFTYERFPVVIDWFVGNDSCEASQKLGTYACTNNTYCDDKGTLRGYLCRCKPGYDGNPYHPNGCKDIDECKTSKHTCISDNNCLNTEGSYKCFCPKGKSGNGTKQGGCHSKHIFTKAILGLFTSLGSIVIFISLWRLHEIITKTMAITRKEKFYRKNGGLLLELKLSRGGVNVDKAKHFSLKNLKKATDNFNPNRVLGKGGQGTVYKGMLADGQIVAVKKFKVEGNVDEFINEVVILSQINHRNVVKLLGCCLEAEIPLLVYEFISNGTLSEYLHEPNTDLPMTWDMRLRIAIEVAESLFYLHSASSQPIYHRDIKSTNILLDEQYRAKVADFGASRMISTEDSHLTTKNVQGTFGYLDPEYFQTSQFTEKSDVYSFGVVLVELLTGQKAIFPVTSQEITSLATYFLCSMKENRVFDIIDERLMNEGENYHIIATANLALRCLNLNGRNRPTMKEVAMELERIRKLESRTSEPQNNEDIDVYGNEKYQIWTAYFTSDTGSTQNSITNISWPSSSSSEVMPILNTP